MLYLWETGEQRPGEQRDVGPHLEALNERGRPPGSTPTRFLAHCPQPSLAGIWGMLRVLQSPSVSRCLFWEVHPIASSLSLPLQFLPIPSALHSAKVH